MAVMSKTPTGVIYLVEETKSGDTYRKAFYNRENAVAFAEKKMRVTEHQKIGDSVWQGYNHKCVITAIYTYDCRKEG